MTECGDYNTVGSRCVKPAGHTDNHESRWGAKWTDQSKARAEAWMREQMKRGRD